MFIPSEYVDNNIFHISYASKTHEFVVTNTLSSSFLKKLNNYRELAGFSDSDLFNYLNSMGDSNNSRTLNVSKVELGFTLILIKFSFLFGINQSFFKDAYKQNFKSSESILDTNKMLYLTNSENQHYFIRYHKINTIDLRIAESNYRVATFKLLDAYISDFYTEDALPQNLSSVFLKSKTPSIVLQSPEMNQFIHSNHYFDIVDLREIKLKFLDILFPPLVAVTDLKNFNRDKLSKIRKSNKNRKKDPHIRPETERLQSYERNDAFKFESDLAIFLSTYDISNDYGTALKNLKKNNDNK